MVAREQVKIQLARSPQAWGAGTKAGRFAAVERRMPTVEWLEARARKRIPKFAFDFVHGGTGTDYGVVRNRAALDAVEIIPRYGVLQPCDTRRRLFGRSYAVPIGISPVGMDALAWPGASRCLAEAAREADIPYIAGTLAHCSIEEIAALCGERAWLQLYGLPRDNHRVTFDLIERARQAGVQVIVATLDAPVRAKRPRDIRNHLIVPFRPRLGTILDMLQSWPWLFALTRSGMPGFGNMSRYVEAPRTAARVAAFVQREIKGTFTWPEIARMREVWPHALVVKGVLHPDDAAEAVRQGVDGILVSNHGGRQTDAAPASIDVLPAIAEAVEDRATVLFDSGIRSGLDAARAIALGAKAVFCGRAFLYGLAAVGDEGASYVSALLKEELEVAMAQCGAWTLADLPGVSIRHPDRWDKIANIGKSQHCAAAKP